MTEWSCVFGVMIKGLASVNVFTSLWNVSTSHNTN